MTDGSQLADRACVPCRGGVPPLATSDAERLLAELHRAWRVVDGHHLSRAFDFEDFRSALAFVNRAGAISEEQGHHPEMTLGWGHVKVEIWTHKIDGLTESDFILAAKFDGLTR